MRKPGRSSFDSYASMLPSVGPAQGVPSRHRNSEDARNARQQSGFAQWDGYRALVRWIHLADNGRPKLAGSAKTGKVRAGQKGKANHYCSVRNRLRRGGGRRVRSHLVELGSTTRVGTCQASAHRVGKMQSQSVSDLRQNWSLGIMNGSKRDRLELWNSSSLPAMPNNAR